MLISYIYYSNIYNLIYILYLLTTTYLTQYLLCVNDNKIIRNILTIIIFSILIEWGISSRSAPRNMAEENLNRYLNQSEVPDDINQILPTVTPIAEEDLANISLSEIEDTFDPDGFLNSANSAPRKKGRPQQINPKNPKNAKRCRLQRTKEKEKKIAFDEELKTEKEINEKLTQQEDTMRCLLEEAHKIFHDMIRSGRLKFVG